jgi:hypothetical protein
VKLAAANGAHMWSKRYGGPLADRGHAIAMRSMGELYITGYFAGTVDFGGIPFTWWKASPFLQQELSH